MLSVHSIVVHFRCEGSLRLGRDRLVSRALRDANKEVSRAGILKPTVRNGDTTFRFHCTYHGASRYVCTSYKERNIELRANSFIRHTGTGLALHLFLNFSFSPLLLSGSRSLRAMISTRDDFKPSHVPLVFPPAKYRVALRFTLRWKSTVNLEACNSRGARHFTKK